MVRHKTRWILVRLDSEESDAKHRNNGTTTPGHMNNNIECTNNNFPSSKILAMALRDNFIECFGLAVSGIALDVRGNVRNNMVLEPKNRIDRKDNCLKNEKTKTHIHGNNNSAIQRSRNSTRLDSDSSGALLSNTSIDKLYYQIE